MENKVKYTNDCNSLFSKLKSDQFSSMKENCSVVVLYTEWKFFWQLYTFSYILVSIPLSPNFDLQKWILDGRSNLDIPKENYKSTQTHSYKYCKLLINKIQEGCTLKHSKNTISYDLTDIIKLLPDFLFLKLFT